VQAAVHGDGPRQLQGARIDDVERTGSSAMPTTTERRLSWRRCCWVAAQADLGHRLAARAVDDVERAVGFVADVDALPVRREVDAVRRLDAVDDLHYLVVRGR